ncbi:glycosyltransferase [Glaciihabitans arcticus]|uniref:Glycosyltransferase n=1 Tax=Glaciihabitans arcticus TaxID=2668039 RepID=A0A4V2JF37_9MICO|nr:WecB/TagA/CpsF family glycosyltransferase [Glaciihabitans arcticus]TBN57989.1 glycosyltransferase [Glaciihabitans arcticus]
MTGGTRGSVVGVPIDALSSRQLVDEIFGWVADAGAPARSALGVNAHVVNLAASDSVFARDVARADLAYADGQSVVWAARLLGTPVPERVATTDLIHPLAERAAAEGVRMFFYGGRPGVAALAAERLGAAHPGLAITVRDGYVAAAGMDALVDEINASGAGLLFVGLGDPLQQRWIAEHRDALTVPAVLSCGGLFDWTSGSNRRAPRWMIRAGLEWLWRLIIEPRRLARRYLVGNPAFVLRVARAKLAA